MIIYMRVSENTIQWLVVEGTQPFKSVCHMRRLAKLTLKQIKHAINCATFTVRIQHIPESENFAPLTFINQHLSIT